MAPLFFSVARWEEQNKEAFASIMRLESQLES